MSDSTTRKQHYVPCFYLKLFSDENNSFYVYDFLNDTLLPRPVYYKSQCYKEYFYGENGLWETKLLNMEGKWATSVRKAINGESLSNDDFFALKEFVVFQRQRTSAENNRSVEERLSIMRECTKTLCYHNGWLFDDKMDQSIVERVKRDVTPAENLQIALDMVKYINDLSILIINYRTEKTLITSDSPVIVLNPFMRFQGFGYGNIGVVFVLPLSPNHLLLVYDGTLFTKHLNDIYIQSNDSDEVERINQYEMIHAERMTFSKDENNLHIRNETKERRDREKERNKTQFLGPEGNRMMALQLSGTEYYYPLPYVMLPRDYNKIPYECREAFPREYEKGWADKLSMKYKVLCIAKKAANQELLSPKKDIKIGCRRMETLAHKYWRKHSIRFGS